MPDVSALEKWSGKIAAADPTLSEVNYGLTPEKSYGWLGSMESITADRIPEDYVAGASSTNWLYLPRNGVWRRRGGQTVQFDTLSGGASVTGLLTAASSDFPGKGRQVEEFLSESVTDGVPTISALVTKETVMSGLDDGWFANFWWRDQVNSANRTMCDEYSTSDVYPIPGNAQTYLVVPLWHGSGDGVITRGVSEFQRRLLLSGSRRFLKVGNWWYFPNLMGTPCRWNGGRAASAYTSLVVGNPILLGTGGGLNWGHSTLVLNNAASPTGTDLTWDDALNDRADSPYLFATGGPGNILSIWNLSTVDNSVASWTVRWRGLYDPVGDAPPSASHLLQWGLTRANGDIQYSNNVTPFGFTVTTSSMGDTMATFTYDLSFAVPYANGEPPNRLSMAVINSGAGLPAGTSVVVADVQVYPTGSSATTAYNRLIPTGPLPPTHAGTLSAGSLSTSSSQALERAPDADGTVNGWLNQASSGSNLYQSIDESTASDLDYIQGPAEGAVGASESCEIKFEDFNFQPADDSVILIKARIRDSSGPTGFCRVALYNGTYEIETFPIFTASDTVTLYTFQVSSAKIAQANADGQLWDDLRVQFTQTAILANFYMQVTWARIFYTPEVAGSWSGRDRFMYSVAYRFEDGSIWAPCTPRFPSTTLTSGYNIFTVDASNPTTRYDYVQWSNIPIGPHGTVGRILLRTTKVDATETGEDLKLNPFDLRIVQELYDNTTTTYRDYQADDFGLAEDSAGLFIRYDHIMPPRSRYIAGGDMRVVHTYGGRNPCAIIIAPVGRAADYDLNVLDTDSTAYSSQGSYMRVRFESDGTKFLDLVQSDGTTPDTVVSFGFSTYTTLQLLVDALNATTFAASTLQWRAQLCPGANPEAPTATSLTPTYREIGSIVTTSGSRNISKAAGGLSVVGVGTFVSGTGITAGSYITRIDSDTQLQLNQNATASGTVELTFYASLGDAPSSGALGWQRVIANSLPGFIYHAESYLDDDPIDKSGVWMTVATPGSSRSAANLWSGKTANFFKPPVSAGISTGGASVDQGFVLPFSDGVYALKNTVNTSSGIDEDYKLIALNEHEGCCAWQTVCRGAGFVPYLKGTGLYAADLDREILLSEAIYQHAPATGGLSYEIPLSIAATGKDDDTAYAIAAVMRGAIWLNYRVSGDTRPSRQYCYDFSTGKDASGLKALLRPNGEPWGWSVPLVRPFTAMGTGRRSDGLHLYGWNDANAGTGIGRIDEFETGETDNGTAISATLLTPWLKADDGWRLSAQEIWIQHKAPAGATVLLDYHRSYSDVTSTLTPSTTPGIVLREIKHLPQAARTVTAACYLGYRQTAGSAAELRSLTPRIRRVQSYT